MQQHCFDSFSRLGLNSSTLPSANFINWKDKCFCVDLRYRTGLYFKTTTPAQSFKKRLDYAIQQLAKGIGVKRYAAVCLGDLIVPDVQLYKTVVRISRSECCDIYAFSAPQSLHASGLRLIRPPTCTDAGHKCSPSQPRPKLLPKLYWRGAPSGIMGFYDDKTWTTSPRVRICSSKLPFVHANLTLPYAFVSETQAKAMATLSAPYKQQGWVAYKFVASIDGFGTQWHLPEKLASSQVVFKVDTDPRFGSPLVESWYHWMQPWVHYVPVRHDLSDISQRFNWALSNAGDANNIVKNANSLAMKLLKEPRVPGVASLCDTTISVAKTSACPSSEWLQRLAPLIRRDKMTMINIGANKGYNVNLLLQQFHREWRTSNAAWKAAMPASVAQSCGVCNDCTEVVHMNQDALVEIIAVDISSENVNLLRHLVSHFSAPCVVIHAAVHSVATVLHEAEGSKSGIEQGGITSHGRAVNGITLDGLIDTQRIPRTKAIVDVLIVDTEGNDGLVLQGGSSAIREQVFRVVIFEYHGIGAWQSLSVNSIVRDLEKHGYTCFWMGSAGLAPFVTACDNNNFRKWSNIICAFETDLVLPLFQLVR